MLAYFLYNFTVVMLVNVYRVCILFLLLICEIVLYDVLHIVAEPYLLVKGKENHRV